MLTASERSLPIWQWAVLAALLLFSGLPAFADQCSDQFSSSKATLTNPRLVTVARADQTQYYERTNRGYHELRSGSEGSVALYQPEFLDAEALRGKRVLDAGTGDGKLVNDLRELGVDAVGVDIYLNSEQRKQPDAFIQSDLRSMPIAANSIDIVYSTFSIFDYEWDNHKILNDVIVEFRRVLKNGGIVRLAPIWGQLGKPTEGDMALAKLFEEVGFEVRFVPGAKNGGRILTLVLEAKLTRP